MLKKNKKKLIAIAAVATLLLTPISALAFTYKSTFEVYSTKGFRGPNRTYNGDITIRTYNKKVEKGSDKRDIKIQLYRYRLFKDEYMATTYHNRIPETTSKLIGFEAGDYYFKFSKPDDGINVKGSVIMND
ncbi:hypothetical protein J6TS2_39790 [Heyndrickxia sporothermodurans]|nr:hypothetical protein J6TS2_39790 [Heyndrickxia sporothermodurans]